jgi:hypothetical protein
MSKEELWEARWYDALACGYSDEQATAIANRAVSKAFPFTRKDRGVRIGSKAGRRQYALRQGGN